MKQETPLQKLIIFINESNGQMTLDGVLEYAQYLLREEKQLVIDAFVQGNREVFYDGSEEVLANNYFNNKYNTK